MSHCYLGIEIGGTKLQLGVGSGNDTQLNELIRLDVDANKGALGILEQIATATSSLQRKYKIKRIGIGFGGPVDSRAGRVIKSHQIHGWDGVELVKWCETTFGISARIGNDCDCAALAEANVGAGINQPCVFYVTVGTGIGGGLVINGRLHGAGRPAVAEIGHLRPGLHATNSDDTVESLASGPGIAANARMRLAGEDVIQFSASHSQSAEEVANYEADLRMRCGQDLQRLNAKLIGQAAGDGNELARAFLDHACQALGWAIAQVITLLSPNVVVVGGGVSLLGDVLFFEPLRRHIRHYCFPPLLDSYRIEPAHLSEEVVVHGALLLAKE